MAEHVFRSQGQGDGVLRSYFRNDPFGRRISKTIRQGNTSKTVYFPYSEQGQLTKAYGFNPVAAQQGLWSTDPIWQAEISNASLTGAQTQYHYLHTDHLGTPQLATTKDGSTSWKAAAEAFGAAGIIQSQSTIEMNLRFPGQYFDQETNSHYNFHRDYKPNLGRYLQSDPIHLEGGLNLFVYLENNPTNSFDTRGVAGECSLWRRIIGWCDPTKLPKKICDKACDKLVDSCKRALGPQCYYAGTPCLYPCEKMGIECEERKAKECNTDACLPPNFGSGGGDYA